MLQRLHTDQDDLARRHGFDALSGLDAILAYVDLNLREMARRNEARAYFMLLSSAVAEASDLRGTFAATHADVEERLRGWVARGQAEGMIRPGLNPGAAALMIGCLLFGVSMQLLVDPAVELDRLREASLTMLRTSPAAQ